MASDGFKLRKWLTNHAELRDLCKGFISNTGIRFQIEEGSCSSMGLCSRHSLFRF